MTAGGSAGHSGGVPAATSGGAGPTGLMSRWQSVPCRSCSVDSHGWHQRPCSVATRTRPLRHRRAKYAPLGSREDRTPKAGTAGSGRGFGHGCLVHRGRATRRGNCASGGQEGRRADGRCRVRSVQVRSGRGAGSRGHAPQDGAVGRAALEGAAEPRHSGGHAHQARCSRVPECPTVRLPLARHALRLGHAPPTGAMSSIRARTRRSISSRMGRTAATPWPAGSGSCQSR